MGRQGGEARSRTRRRKTKRILPSAIRPSHSAGSEAETSLPTGAPRKLFVPRRPRNPCKSWVTLGWWRPVPKNTLLASSVPWVSW
eukprot:5403166-Pyramimonas_sp.AAC.1